MDPSLAVEAGRELISNGVLGIAVVGLVYYVFIQRRDLKDQTLAAETKIAEKDKLIKELNDLRVAEARAGSELARTMQTTMDALVATINQRRTR